MWRTPARCRRYSELRAEAVAIGIGGTVARPPPSRPGEFHPEPLTEPDLNLSAYPARATHGRLPSSTDIEFLRCPVDSDQYGWPAPFAPRELPRINAPMEQSAPGLRIGTFGLTGFPLVPFPLPSQTKFSSSVRKPRLESRPLYTGHRTASK
jgi:hypothetical protein